MIPVPEAVQAAFAALFGTTMAQLSHFGGGRQEGDGIIYAYPAPHPRQGEAGLSPARLRPVDGGPAAPERRLLKVMAIPAAEQQRGLFCLEERLRFMRFRVQSRASPCSISMCPTITGSLPISPSPARAFFFPSLVGWSAPCGTGPGC